MNQKETKINLRFDQILKIQIFRNQLTNKEKYKISEFCKNQNISEQIIKSSLKLNSSIQSILRFLQIDNNFQSVEVVPPSSQFQKLVRLKFCKSHNDDNLSYSIFLEECSIQMHCLQKKLWKFKNQSKIKVTQPNYPQKLNIWGAISKKQLLTFIFSYKKSIENCIKILKQRFVPFKKQMFKNKIVSVYKDNNPQTNIQNDFKIFKMFKFKRVEDQPPYSPDLKPIENVWAWLQQKIKRDNPITIEQLNKYLRKY
ncbi:hypothetical protein ABPG72_006598 [Tetrahymena utriculariae]